MAMYRQDLGNDPGARARAKGSIDASEDADRLALGLDGYLLLGNRQFVATQDPATIDRAPHAVEHGSQRQRPRKVA